MIVRVGAPAPKIKLAVVDATVGPLEAQAANKLNSPQQSALVPDVDAFLQARASVRQRGMLPSLSQLLDVTPMHSRAEGKKLGIEVRESIKALASVYADGRVTEDEMDLLQQSASRLREVANLFQPQILNMLPRDTRERLQNEIMGPVHTLLDAADRRNHAITEQVTVNLAWVQSNPEVREYGFLDLATLAQHGGTIAGFDRYEPGDMIAVARSDGSTTLGIVRETGLVGDAAGGGSVDGKLLVAEFLAPNGQIASKKMSSGDVVAANPLKIGDMIDTKDGRVWVTGVGNGGVRGVLDRNGKQENVDAKWLQSLAVSCASILGTMRAQGSTAAPLAAKVNEPQVFRQVLGAGGHESTSPEGARGSQMSVCFFTYRGIGYADYNEDGAVMGVVPKGNGVAHETGFAGAFDQAGGAGHVEGQTGAASLLAAQRFEEASAQIAHGAPPEATLKAAVQQAHEQVKALGVGAASTFAATVVRENVAHVINCGDSAVMVYGKNGSLKFATDAHNLGDIIAKTSGDPNAGLGVANVVTAALGADSATADYTAVKVEKGDVIVCVSDGVADANLAAQKADHAAGKPWTELNGVRTNREIGDLIYGLNQKGARSAEMTQAIIDYGKQHVEDGRGKKDNVTACVMRVT